MEPFPVSEFINYVCFGTAATQSIGRAAYFCAVDTSSQMNTLQLDNCINAPPVTDTYSSVSLVVNKLTHLSKILLLRGNRAAWTDGIKTKRKKKESK